MKFDISNILSLAFLATATAKAIPDDSTPITAVASSEKEDSKLLEIKEKCGEANLIDHEGQYVCLKPYEKDVPSNIEEILMQKIVFYQDEYHVIDPLYSSQCSESSDVLDCYINVAEVVGKNVTSIIPKLDDNAEDLSDNTKMSLSEYYCGKDNFYEANGKYVCLTLYHGYFNVNVEEMFNKRIVHYNDEYYLVNYLFSNVCELSPDYMQCYNDLTEILDSDFNSLLPLYDFEVDTPEIRNPLAENEVDVEEILDKYRCDSENFYSLDHLHVCLDPVEKSDVPSEANIAMAININILYNGQYYIVNKDFSSMGVYIAGYPVFNYEKIAHILGTTIEDIVPKKGDSIDDEIDLILTGDYCISKHISKELNKSVCLTPYDKDIPSNIEEILMQKIIFYQDKYYLINTLQSSECSESSDVLDCYISVAEVVGENVTSIIPKLDDNAEDLSDDTKIGLSKYYCGKDNFYEANGKYVCLTPYHGYFNINVNEMFNKRIVHYNNEYYLVNYLFSNVCELSPDYMQCYNDLVKIFDSDLNSLLPLYDFEVDTPKIRNPLAENEVDVEEILDKYRCGPENFYSLDHLHVCLDPVEKSDVPSEANIAMSVNINILYNEQYYTVNKDFSSMGVHIAGYPVFNYEKIARILGTTIKDIVPKKGDSIDEEIDSILTGDYCINQYNNKVLSKTVCLTPYDGPIPSTVEERQTQGIINYYNVYYQINRENSNVCGEDDSSKCYDELASILKEDKATLLGEVKP